MEKKKNKTVVILGAGLAGLAAGLELTRAGKKVIILEKNPYIGGLATTFQIGNYRFDTGPHRWFTKIDEVDKWLREIMDKELITVSRLTRIYFNKKYYYYPIKPFDALKGIGPLKAAKAIFDYFLIKSVQKIRPQPIISMEDAYIHQFGQTLYKTFFEKYSEKLWGRKCQELSGDWVVQRSRGMSILTVIKNAFFPQKGKVVSLVEEFSYPRLGVGRIAQKLASEIQKGDGKIVLSANIIKIKRENEEIKKVIFIKDGKEEEITGEEFISSIPLNFFVNILRPLPPKEIIKANSNLAFRSGIFVALFLKRGKITGDQWIYTQDSSLPFVRFVETDNWSDSLSPKGTTSLVFEIACDKDDKIWKMDDEKLVDWVAEKYIREFKTINKDDILGSFVHRQENEYPIYKIGYQNPLKLIKGYLKKIKNLQIIGRSGMYRYNNMDHAIQSGIWAARNLLGGNYNLEKINIEKEYHEEKKAS